MEKTKSSTRSLLQLGFEEINPFWLNLIYLISVSFLGSFLLLLLPMKDPSIPRPAFLDLFFMSVSAATVSSTASLEIESFSNSQLIVFTLLMLLGGEVFVSMLGLAFHNHNYRNHSLPAQRELELGTLPIKYLQSSEPGIERETESLKLSSSKHLLYVVLGYLVLVHMAGSLFILAYLSLFPGPMAVLQGRGIRAKTFAVFTAVSSFANCGFIPTNENMAVFRACPGVLLAVAALVLLGNTIYPVGLRCAVWALSRVTKRREFNFILSGDDRRWRLGYSHHLMRREEVGMLGVTVGGFVAVQALMLGCLQWRSEGLDGMSGYQKVIGSLFMAVNSRHAGESIVDISAVSPAILALFVVMM